MPHKNELKDESKHVEEDKDTAITFAGFFGESQIYEAPRFDLLRSHKGSHIYTKMMEDDQITICFNLIASSITERRWKFEGPNAEFFDRMVGEDFKGNFKTTIKNLTFALIYGYILLEKIYDQVEIDGKTFWTVNEIKTKPVESFKFKVDKFGNIIQLLQKQGGNPNAPLDLHKFLYYVYQPHFNPQFGRSVLFPAYRHYWAKDNILKFWNIWLERAAVGFIHGTMETDLAPGQSTNLTNALKGLSGKSFILTPAGVDLKYVAQRDMSAFNNAVRHKDSAIAKAMFVPHTLGVSPQDATGTNAQTAVHYEEVFFNWVKDNASAIADVFNEQLFNELEMLNFGTKETKFVFDELLTSEKRKIAKSWAELVKEGAVQRSDEDENHIRGLLGFPELDDEFDDLDRRKNSDSEVIPDNGIGDVNPISSGDGLITNTYTLTKKQLSKISNALDTLTEDFELELQSELDPILDQVTELTLTSKKIEDIEVSKTATLSIKRLLKNQMRKVARKATALARAEIRVSKKLTLSPELIDAFINSKSLKILSELIDSAIVEKSKQIFMNGVKNELTNVEITQQLDELLQPYISSIGSSVAVARIVRTTVTEVFNEARKSFFEQTDFVEAYEYSAILDVVTTDICRNLDNKIWPVDDPRWDRLTPPNHFNCRSLLIPVTKNDNWKTSSGLPNGIDAAPGFGKD